jgi:hypothetical protein
LRASGPARNRDRDTNCDTSSTVSDHLQAQRPADSRT